MLWFLLAWVLVCAKRCVITNFYEDFEQRVGPEEALNFRFIFWNFLFDVRNFSEHGSHFWQQVLQWIRNLRVRFRCLLPISSLGLFIRVVFDRIPPLAERLLDETMVVDDILNSNVFIINGLIRIFCTYSLLDLSIDLLNKSSVRNVTLRLRLNLSHHVIESQIFGLCLYQLNQLLAYVLSFEIIIISHDVISQSLKLLSLLIDHACWEQIEIPLLVVRLDSLLVHLLLGVFFYSVLETVKEGQRVEVHSCPSVQVHPHVAQFEVNFLNVILNQVDCVSKVVGVLGSVDAVLLPHLFSDGLL